MASSEINTQRHNYRNDKENGNAVESTKGEGHVITYKPAGKPDREARRKIYDRYIAMKQSPLRLEAEKRWELGDKMYRMWAPDRDPDDWHADIVLPDAFAAIQTHMQDTLGLRSRPFIKPRETSDEALAYFTNEVFQGAMDQTDFDIEVYKAKNCAAIRGNAYTMEEYRYETREVQDPVSFDEGEIKYKKREIVDWDDVYTRWIDNWAVFIDDSVDDPKYATDQIYREVMTFDSYKDEYIDKPGFKDTECVKPAGSVGAQARFFQLAEDMEENDVEILHYWNKISDSYDVLANNVLIRRGPMPNRHKQLPIDTWNFYVIPGQVWGLGIPQIIYTLVEERRSGRNMAADRNKMSLDKLFLVNDLFDLDEEEMTPRPHGIITVNTNGLPIQQAIQALEYGDVPVSSLRFNEDLLMEQRRAHGLDDRPAQTQGGTATENAIISEAAMKRINMINALQNMTTMKYLGMKKWSNVQFFYPGGRMERIMENNKWKERRVYKTISVEGLEFNLQGDKEKGQKPELRFSPIKGGSRIKLDPKFARFLDTECDIVIDAATDVVESRATTFARVSELLMGMKADPYWAQELDANKSMTHLFRLAGQDPKDFMKGEGFTDAEMEMLAERENGLFINMDETGRTYAIPGTPGATTAHTLVHLNFTETERFAKLPQHIKDAITNHILEENENNPQTASVQKQIQGLSGQPGESAPMEGAPTAPAPSGGDAIMPGAPGGENVANAMVSDGQTVNGGQVTQEGLV